MGEKLLLQSARRRDTPPSCVGWQVLEEDSLPRVFVHWEELRRTLEKGDFMVSTWQLQSLLLCILMEPESMWGLAKYDQFAFLRGRKDYPILRIP